MRRAGAAGIDYVERDPLTIRMQNTPGAGAAVLRLLSDANINIDLFKPVRIFDDQFYAVICPNDIPAARTALGDRVVTT